MMEEIMKTYRNHFKNPLNSSTIQQRKNETRKTIDFDKDTEFIISQITPDSSFILVNSKRNSKTKSASKNHHQKHKHKHDHQHTKCSSCIHCHPYFRMLKKQKKNLINYINNNKPKYIKLIGNNRYTNTSPKKYVYDNSKEIPGRKMGLIPLPVNKKKKKLNKIDSSNYYELQRSIVMMRRIQYDRKIRKGNMNNYVDDVIYIQRWWKHLKRKEKIIKIQRAFREFLKRQKIKRKNKIKRNSIEAKNILNKILYKKGFDRIYKAKFIKKPLINNSIMRKYNKLNNNYCYITKKRNIISIDYKNKINDIQTNYRRLEAIRKKYRLMNRAFKPINFKHSLITKITVNESILDEKIKLLQKNIRHFLYENKKRNENMIKRSKYKNKENSGLYIDKVYLTDYILKVIIFNKKLKHAMQSIVLGKKSTYKNIKDYNINDIKKISKIQNIYKSHYNKYHINKKDLIKIYSNKTYINCYISKKYIQKNNAKLLLIQKALKTTLKKIRFEKNIIKNKPTSFSYLKIPKIKTKNLGIINNNQNFSIINKYNNNENNNVFNNLDNFSFKGNSQTQKVNSIYEINSNESINILSSREFNKNNTNYNLVSFITKKYVINVDKKLINLQRTIKSFIFKERAKKDYYNKKNCLMINKNHINNNFYITKKYTNEKECLDKIIAFQIFYKNRLEYFKNNIIKFTISTDKEERNVINFGLPGYKKNNNYNYNNNKFNFGISGMRNNNYYNIKDYNSNSNNKYKNYNNNKNTIETNPIELEYQPNKKASRYKRHSCVVPRTQGFLLSYLLERNRKPIQKTQGNYYEKIRVTSKIYEQFHYKNKNHIILKQSNRGIYISKNRYKNNIPQIKLIQKKIKNRENLKTIQKAKDIILKKPLNQNYIICDETQNENNNKNKTKNTNTYKSKKKEKDKKKEKQKEERNSFNSLNNSI